MYTFNSPHLLDGIVELPIIRISNVPTAKLFSIVCLTGCFLISIGAQNTVESQLVMKLLDNTSPDYTVGRDSKCMLHSLEMYRTEVDIVYGLRN